MTDAVVADTAAGPFVVKLRGAAHGTAALVAEIIVAEIAEAIELRVPSRASWTASMASGASGAARSSSSRQSASVISCSGSVGPGQDWQ